MINIPYFDLALGYLILKEDNWCNCYVKGISSLLFWIINRVREVFTRHCVASTMRFYYRRIHNCKNHSDFHILCNLFAEKLSSQLEYVNHFQVQKCVVMLGRMSDSCTEYEIRDASQAASSFWLLSHVLAHNQSSLYSHRNTYYLPLSQRLFNGGETPVKCERLFLLL